MLKTQYHLAEFNRPITEGTKLPEHIIEKPAMDRNQNPGLQYRDLRNFVHAQNNPNQNRYRAVEEYQKPCLVYEENTDKPQKFYGKKVGTISASIIDGQSGQQAEIPNYAFLIFDVS